jgi:hypothetical protein
MGCINVGSFCHMGDNMLNLIMAIDEMWARPYIPELK